MRGMAADAEGPRLRPRRRRLAARRIAHICLRLVECVAALFIVGGLALASLLARGPLRLVGMHDQIQTSLQERVGDRYDIVLGPTYLMHDSWGVGLGFKGLTVRGSIVGTRQDLEEALDFYAQGKIHPTVSTRELSEVNAVLDEMKHAKIDGRVVIKY